MPLPNSGVGCVAAMSLLPDKTMFSYQKVFKFIKEEMKILDPKVLYTDFKAGILAAAQQILSSSLCCCDVHWKRIIKEHIGKSGLQGHYQKDPLFQNWIHKIWALALLPKDDIIEVRARFVLKAAPRLEEKEGDEDSTKLQKRVLNKGIDDFIGYMRRT